MLARTQEARMYNVSSYSIQSFILIIFWNASYDDADYLKQCNGTLFNLIVFYLADCFQDCRDVDCVNIHKYTVRVITGVH